MITKRFGPSGSLKEWSSIPENTIDVTPKISSDVFFECKFIVYIISNLGVGRLEPESCVDQALSSFSDFLLIYRSDAFRAA